MSSTRRRSESDEKPACPHCGYHHIQRRTGAPGAETRSEDWRCEGCGRYFDDPAYRKMESNDDPKTGMAALLADPEVTSIEEAKDKL